eukprot:6204965-Pleurochrysis_carterae.AAC.6
MARSKLFRRFPRVPSCMSIPMHYSRRVSSLSLAALPLLKSVNSQAQMPCALAMRKGRSQHTANLCFQRLCAPLHSTRRLSTSLTVRSVVAAPQLLPPRPIPSAMSGPSNSLVRVGFPVRLRDAFDETARVCGERSRAETETATEAEKLRRIWRESAGGERWRSRRRRKRQKRAGRSF